MKRRLRRLLALVCALALALSLSGPASAAGDIYFTVINDSVVSLSDSTMPPGRGACSTSPTPPLTAATLPASALTSRSATTAVRAWHSVQHRQFLTFNLNNNTCYNAVTGEYLNGRAILRSGRVFVPVALVCSFFGLSYSVISIDEGYIVRIKDSSVVLSDAKFVEAATLSISRELRAYNQANQSTAAPGVRPPTGSSGETETTDPPIEEEPDTADSVRSIWPSGATTTRDSAIFWTLWMRETGPRCSSSLWRVWSGRTTCYTAFWAAATAWAAGGGEHPGRHPPAAGGGGRTLERVGYTRTTLALVPESQRSALEAEGWVCWTRRCPPSPRRGREPAPTPTRSSAPSPPAASGLISRWTPEASRPGCFPRLLTRLEARSYAVSVPLETRL